MGASYPHSDRGHPHPPFPLEDTVLPASLSCGAQSGSWLGKDPAKGRVGQMSAAVIFSFRHRKLLSSEGLLGTPAVDKRERGGEGISQRDRKIGHQAAGKQHSLRTLR